MASQSAGPRDRKAAASFACRVGLLLREIAACKKYNNWILKDKLCAKLEDIEQVSPTDGRHVACSPTNTQQGLSPPYRHDRLVVVFCFVLLTVLKNPRCCLPRQGCCGYVGRNAGCTAGCTACAGRRQVPLKLSVFRRSLLFVRHRRDPLFTKVNKSERLVHGRQLWLVRSLFLVFSDNSHRGGLDTILFGAFCITRNPALATGNPTLQT